MQHVKTDAAEAVVRGKLIGMKAHIKKVSSARLSLQSGGQKKNKLDPKLTKRIQKGQSRNKAIMRPERQQTR